MPDPQDHRKTWLELKNGSANALQALYNEHYLGLMNYGFKLVGSRDLINDSITQVLIDLWDSRNRLPVVENVRSYLMTSVRRKIFSELKADKTRATKDHEHLLSQEQVELSYEEKLTRFQSDKALKEKILKTLDKLTDRQKQLLQMKFFDDLDYDEIAAQCNISKRTAYNSIYDAVKILRTELYKDQNDPLLLTLPFPFLICLQFLS